MKNLRKIGVFCGIISISILGSGCEKIQSSLPEDGYNTDVAMSAVEYSIFLSKQISVIENILMTRMTMADSVANGSYNSSLEIANTEEAISKISAVKDELYVTMPAQSFDTDRQTILDLVEDALDILIEYQNNLKNSSMTAIKNSGVKMKNCMLALSGEANAYYQ